MTDSVSLRAKDLNDWSPVELGKIIQLKYGKGLKAADRMGGGIPVFGSGGVVGFHDAALVRGPGVVVGRKGNVGAAYWSEGDFYPIDTTYFVETQQDLRFIYYLLSTLTFENSHAAVPGLSRETAYAKAVLLPPLEQQRLISATLRIFDLLIENNRRRIELLEETARLLYREWFVNFRYPGHEDVPLVDSELGPTPQGWEVRSVGSVCELIRGRSYTRDELVEQGGMPFLNLKCVSRGGGFRLDGIKRYQGQFKPAQQTYPGETVIAMTDMTQERNVIGQAARVPSLDADFGVISLDLNRVIPNPGVDPDYLYTVFRYSAFSRTVKEFANGTNVLHLSPSSIENHDFVLAPEPLQQSFGDLIQPALELADHLQQQSELLRELQDLLLPRLVSGDLDISGLDLGLKAAS